MQLTQQDITSLNVLSRWLALDTFTPETAAGAEILILAGHAIVPNIEAALQFAAQHQMKLLISGGIGHSTALLKQALNDRARQKGIQPPQGETEAAMLQHIAVHEYQLSDDRVVCESLSTNCGENAEFSLKMLEESGQIPANVLLVQDPLMQRRTIETFRFAWRETKTAFISWPVFTPQLHSEAERLSVVGAGTGSGLWDIERYLSMITGEIRRLQDNPQGYGPAGAGFIGHVDFPSEVTAACQRLVADNPALNAASR